ncbi:hypothetical protein TNCV_3607181 [Trichonephila clavipes]|nr:hypothetical protein TNCV_3607181 [Trichonephila clavipes]
MLDWIGSDLESFVGDGFEIVCKCFPIPLEECRRVSADDFVLKKDEGEWCLHRSPYYLPSGHYLCTPPLILASIILSLDLINYHSAKRVATSTCHHSDRSSGGVRNVAGHPLPLHFPPLVLPYHVPGKKNLADSTTFQPFIRSSLPNNL